VLDIEQVAKLINRTDINPNLSTIISRSREGCPVSDFPLADVRAGLEKLITAATEALADLSLPVIPIARLSTVG
jgi:hypothetical protein